jgi:hypothetical protein
VHPAYRHPSDTCSVSGTRGDKSIGYLITSASGLANAHYPEFKKLMDISQCQVMQHQVQANSHLMDTCSVSSTNKHFILQNYWVPNICLICLLPSFLFSVQPLLL